MTTIDPTEAAAVRAAVKELARLRPGKAVELRVPPYAAAQLGTGDSTPGPRHTRGTPPAVVEMDPATFLALVAGDVTYEEARRTHRLRASGAHADLSSLFPLRNG